MVGLAEINANAPTEIAPSILTLFGASDAARPEGLTPVDTAFLKSLYSLRGNYRSQRSLVVNSMMHDLTQR